MYCQKCGQDNGDQANFCLRCGAPMNQPGRPEPGNPNPGNANAGTVKPSKPKRNFPVFLIIIIVIASIFSFVLFVGLVFGITSSVPEKIDSAPVEVTVPEFTLPDTTLPEITLPEITLPEIELPSDDNYIDFLSGEWESVYLTDGTSNLTVHALAFGQTVYSCKQFSLYMNVEMNAGTKCHDWQVWGRRNGTFEKIAKIYLPSGQGVFDDVVRFNSPVTFDAIAVTPTIPGGYSWSLSLGVYDVYMS